MTRCDEGSAVCGSIDCGGSKAQSAWTRADAKREMMAWSGSGLLRAAYARQRGLPEAQLWNWKTRLYRRRRACVNGLSLHARRMVEASDREGLERLCRYGLRAPFSNDRLLLDTDGRVHLRLLRPWPGPGGKTEVVFEPIPFMKRLVALIP